VAELYLIWAWILETSIQELLVTVNDLSFGQEWSYWPISDPYVHNVFVSQ
jgi:hypothetical protein